MRVGYGYPLQDTKSLFSLLFLLSFFLFSFFNTKQFRETKTFGSKKHHSLCLENIGRTATRLSGTKLPIHSYFEILIISHHHSKPGE